MTNLNTPTIPLPLPALMGGEGRERGAPRVARLLDSQTVKLSQWSHSQLEGRIGFTQHTPSLTLPLKGRGNVPCRLQTMDTRHA